MKYHFCKHFQSMIKTKRLTLLPLNYAQLLQYLQPGQLLEKEMGLANISRSISPELKEAFEKIILPNVADSTKNYLYFTLWLSIDRAENKITGGLSFKGEPNAAGEIEIGYGTNEIFRGRGYMTEAVGGMIAWVSVQEEVKFIIAETDLLNIASHKVLERNGFQPGYETETMRWWQLVL